MSEPQWLMFPLTGVRERQTPPRETPVPALKTGRGSQGPRGRRSDAEAARGLAARRVIRLTFVLHGASLASSAPTEGVKKYLK